jgi:hypothetical protein
MAGDRFRHPTILCSDARNATNAPPGLPAPPRKRQRSRGRDARFHVVLIGARIHQLRSTTGRHSMRDQRGLAADGLLGGVELGRVYPWLV